MNHLEPVISYPVQYLSNEVLIALAEHSKMPINVQDYFSKIYLPRMQCKMTSYRKLFITDVYSEHLLTLMIMRGHFQSG